MQSYDTALDQVGKLLKVFGKSYFLTSRLIYAMKQEAKILGVEKFTLFL